MTKYLGTLKKSEDYCVSMVQMFSEM